MENVIHTAEEYAALVAELASLRASMESKKSNKSTVRVGVFGEELESKEYNMSLKVSAKGAVSIYGFGRWPNTSYAAHLLYILDHAQEIRHFIATAEGLSYKLDAAEVAEVMAVLAV